VIARGVVASWFTFERTKYDSDVKEGTLTQRISIPPVTKFSDYVIATVEVLQKGGRYVYRDLDNEAGFYESPLIAAIIAQQWFKKGGQGTKAIDKFRPMPYATIAMVASAIHSVLDEWKEGYHQGTSFSEANYKAVYDAHVEALWGWEKDDPAVALFIRKELFKQVTKSLHVDPSPSVSFKFGTAQFRQAAQEHAERRAREEAD